MTFLPSHLVMGPHHPTTIFVIPGHKTPYFQSIASNPTTSQKVWYFLWMYTLRQLYQLLLNHSLHLNFWIFASQFGSWIWKSSGQFDFT